MKNVKSIIGYTTAIFLLLFLIFSFIREDLLEKLVIATGIHPTEWYSGGKVIETEQDNGYILEIHQPVFKTLYGEAADGFVQLTIRGKYNMPAIIDRAISIDGYDFTIQIDTKAIKAKLSKTGEYVKKILWIYQFSDKSLNIRIELKNKNK